MKKKTTVIVMLAIVIAMLAGVAVYAVANYGSASDPLVTASYLRDVVQPTMMDQYQSALNSAVDTAETQFSNELSSAVGSYQTVTLAAGQTLRGGVGTEVLLRSGSAVASSALVDSTSGSTLAAGGSLTANHLYFVQTDGAAVRTDADATLMVRGGYSIG